MENLIVIQDLTTQRLFIVDRRTLEELHTFVYADEKTGKLIILPCTLGYIES